MQIRELWHNRRPQVYGFSSCMYVQLETEHSSISTSFDDETSNA